MRLLSFLLLSTLSFSAFAEPEAVPDNLVPLQEFDNSDGAADDGPAVTIVQRTEQTIEEYRAGGKLYMIKVIPENGKPYYLVDEQGDGKFSRQESLDSGIRPPRWVIHRF
jgi:hypothetical protein